MKEQRLLLFVMKKSLEPSILTAGKVYVFSLESFTTVKQLTTINVTKIFYFIKISKEKNV